MPAQSTSVDVHLENGAVFNVPITPKTQVGQIVVDMAHRASAKPNLQTAGLYYMGSMLPLDMRICGLPEGSRLEFRMKLEAPALQSVGAAASRSIATDSNVTILVELPGSKVSRRVVVKQGDAISALREALNIPPGLHVFYNKRPILDESRTIHSLHISEAHSITFGKVVDNSFVTTATGHNASMRSGVSGGRQDNTIVLADLMTSSLAGRSRDANASSGSFSALNTSARSSVSYSQQARSSASGNLNTSGGSFGAADRRSGLGSMGGGGGGGGAGDASFDDGRPPHSIKIRMSDPEDEGFIHTVYVHGERKVASLRQFIADQHGYDIYCDSAHVTDATATFRDVTGGCDGSLFVFKRRAYF
jgi:hypothetical protein